MNKMKALKSSALVAMTYIVTSPVFAQATDISADTIVAEVNKARPIMIAIGTAVIGLAVIGLIIAFSLRTAGGR